MLHFPTLKVTTESLLSRFFTRSVNFSLDFYPEKGPSDLDLLLLKVLGVEFHGVSHPEQDSEFALKVFHEEIVVFQGDLAMHSGYGDVLDLYI
jgi:hypothetical protein